MDARVYLVAEQVPFHRALMVYDSGYLPTITSKVKFFGLEYSAAKSRMSNLERRSFGLRTL